jgi:hypothetical protein
MLCDSHGSASTHIGRERIGGRRPGASARRNLVRLRRETMYKKSTNSIPKNRNALIAKLPLLFVWESRPRAIAGWICAALCGSVRLCAALCGPCGSVRAAECTVHHRVSLDIQRCAPVGAVRRRTVDLWRPDRADSAGEFCIGRNCVNLFSLSTLASLLSTTTVALMAEAALAALRAAARRGVPPSGSGPLPLCRYLSRQATTPSAAAMQRLCRQKHEILRVRCPETPEMRGGHS